MARSVQPTSVSHSRTIAATTASERQDDPDQVEIRCAVVMTYVIPTFRPFSTLRRIGVIAMSCSLPTKCRAARTVRRDARPRPPTSCARSCPGWPTRSSPRSPPRSPTTRGRWRARSARWCGSASRWRFSRFVDLVVDARGRPRAARARPTSTSAAASSTPAAGWTPCWPPTGSARALAWRRFVEAGEDGGLAPEVLYDLGEAIFAYIDELSAESAEGYAGEQSAAAGERQRRRRAAGARCSPRTAGRGARRRVRAAAAAAAGWALPRELAALGGAAAGGGERRRGSDGADATPTAARARLGAARGAVGGRRRGGVGLACVFVPDPDAPGRRRAARGRARRASRAALGPIGCPGRRRARASRRAAGARCALAGRGRAGSSPTSTWPRCCSRPTPRSPPSSPPRGSRRCDGLAGGPARAARRRRCAPGWTGPGQVQAVAAALGVHPQTVRYRLARCASCSASGSRTRTRASSSSPRASTWRAQPLRY